MFRVLLPEGEITESSSIEFIVEEVDKDAPSLSTFSRIKSADEYDKVNAIFIHLKSPSTKSLGYLISNFSQKEIKNIQSNLLEKGYYDFTKFKYVFSDEDLLTIADLKEDEKYYMLFSDSDFEAFFEN